MTKHLVIVESPAKAKTIEKYLGKNTYKVMASYGHVRDLVPKEGAVDTEHDFKMMYEPIERNARHMDAITQAMKSCDDLFLATDPDREGEAIAWHVKQLLDAKGALKEKNVARVVFHQITKNAVQQAINNPREISMNLVNAQQARRALDYLVGFNLSPLLWKKVRAGLSAGRVQSPALRMIVEREIEIENFKSQEYWTVHAALLEKNQPFSAKLTHYNGEKLEQFSLSNETQAHEAQKTLTDSAKGQLKVNSVVKKERKRHPAPPFITSTLQQEAARKLGFSAAKTMQIAQQLYEAGLITYMRTDSVTLASEAIQEIRECIQERFGAENLPESPRMYKTKSKNAQEAHEAIRPTAASSHPDDLKSSLDKDQYRLYDLIWKRSMACQMIEATLNTVAVDLVTNNHTFRANGSTIIKPGFISVYQEDQDDTNKEDAQETLLPELKEGQSVTLESIKPEQHFTEPPPRYTEASLVKALEEHDIGRPSTYASIISTLKSRGYADIENKRFKATDVARVVNRFLTDYFTQYVDYNFTAKLEDELDDISRGEKEWVPVLKEFWKPFITLVESTTQNVKRSDVTQEKIEENCPKCGKQLAIRLGRNGRFIGCTAYPECDYTRNREGDSAPSQEIINGRLCPDCESPLLVRHGRFGKFIGCSNYPKCKFIEPLEKPKNTNVTCPKCKKGKILQRKSQRGKIFYSCDRYPDCQYAIWNEPIDEPCPKCHWPILSIKTTKKHGDEKICPQKECGFSEPYTREKSEED